MTFFFWAVGRKSEWRGKCGWLDNKRYQDVTGPSYTYTPGGKLAKRTWQRGIETAYAYNTFGDLVGVDYSDSATPDVSYVYNRDGRRQQVTDGSGVRTISYDALGQVATESYTSGPLAGLSLSRGTDPLLRKTSLTLEKGGSTLWSQGFGYGDASRLASVTMGDDAVQYGYVPNSPLVGSMAFAHSGSTVMTTTKQYDAVNRLTQTSSAVGSTVVSSHQNSTINALDQRKRTDLADGKNWRYEYNSRGELTRGVLYGTNNQAISGMDFRYTYDNSGNRLTRSQGSSILTTYTSNLVNQYTTIAEAATATPSYDADGNMTSSGSAYDDRILEYDGENRLTTIRSSGDQAVVATYTYDDQGRRVRVQTSSAAPQGAGDVVNVWDGWNLVGELDYTSATGTHQPRRTYAWGLDLSGSEQGAGGIGGLVIQRDATSGDAYFPAYDPNGNLTTLVKSSDGTVGARYSYDPCGNLLSISSDPYSGTNRFRFSTKYFCSETELYYYGYRYYNPETGRWASRDPIGERGGINVYSFAANDGINNIDILGLAKAYLCCSKEQISKCKAAEAGALAATRDAARILQESFKPVDIYLKYPRLQSVSADELVSIITWYSSLSRNLKLMESGFSGNQYTIKCEKEDKGGGDVNGEAPQNAFAHFVYGILGTDYISIFPVFFTRNQDEQTKAVFHEGSHFFASTSDTIFAPRFRSLPQLPGSAYFMEDLYKNQYNTLNAFWYVVEQTYGTNK